MAFDGLVTAALVSELNKKIINSKIDKIYQPERDEIILSIRGFEGNYRLLMSASSSIPRIHFTAQTRENPMTAPMFCMFLRKQIGGGRILSVSQIGMDRVIKMEIETYTELGDKTTKFLIIEIMGRHSNIILTNSENKILDSIKHIDFTVSSVRQILPSLIYELPPSQGKLNPLNTSSSDIKNALDKAGDIPLDKFIMNTFMGISPLVSREIASTFENKNGSVLSKFLFDFFDSIKNEKFTPTVLFDAVSKKPSYFSCIDIRQYEGAVTVNHYVSISEAIDEFYNVRDKIERMGQKSASLIKLISNNIERCEKKLAIHYDNLIKCEKKDELKVFGDIVTANIYRITQGAENLTAENYYTGEDVTIPLIPELSPSKNAQRYYNLYNKAKNTEKYSTIQIAETEKEKEYLESVLESAQKAQTSGELAEIREELAEQKYLEIKNKKKKSSKPTISKPLEFTSSDGYTILVGKNNKQNDMLTLKMSYSTDLWFHTKNIPGSHTIVKTNGKKEVPDSTILEAAAIAAANSKAANSSKVPVDYTFVSNVKKPNGAKPGMVIYDNYNTVYVNPKTD